LPSPEVRTGGEDVQKNHGMYENET
jgi:hypothetical protein